MKKEIKSDNYDALKNYVFFCFNLIYALHLFLIYI